MFVRLTSIYSQLSVANAIVKRATAMIDVIVAKLNVTAEQGILMVLLYIKMNMTLFTI